MPSHLKCEDCGATFIYAAKQTITKPYNYLPDIHTSTWEHTTQTIEVYVCPFCEKNRIIEAPEETQTKGKITALISVPNSEVNTRLAEGYEVMEDKIYAKETIMIKRESIAELPSNVDCGNIPPAIVAEAEGAYQKLDKALNQIPQSAEEEREKFLKSAETADKTFQKAQP
jgi:hypothetical protein